ncbi:MULTISPECIES: magnesium and cobalt transport protein CorA [Actinomadura]|jgi:magnesium transporter|uniref:Magnesium and cobalt transport protein CorA n=1 Tax=Actinomadura geliboluensis TaxID=882440 RepID=A0A5S4H678_9ACTN|nr:magnesium and cobalt transport protein CorA [Actinomadura geliboluensis]TMR40452.1 magnesium and cobalt transport protein CorA [Actinomadura geliboluensis]
MAMTRVRPGRALFKTRGRPSGVQAPNRDSAVIDWAAYIDGHRVCTDTVADAVRMIRDGRLTPAGDSAGFVWVGLHEPSATELADIAEVFGLHPLAVEDAIHAHQRPKLERYDDVHFVVMKTVGYVPSEPGGAEVVVTGEIMLFCGPDFVVTVRHGTHGELGTVRRDLEHDPARLALGPAAVLHAVADRVVDGYVGVADAVMEDIDEVEEAVFSPERTDESRRIYRLKREVIQLKRAVGPLAGPLRNLSGRRFVPAEIKEYLRDVEDHLTRVREQVESYDELLNPILQAHMTQVTVADNKDMRKISAWGAIFMVPTAIAGVYGMNFKFMPETQWHYGYPLILGVIGLACLSLYRGFRRNGWL